jgi:hypothetical protein
MRLWCVLLALACCGCGSFFTEAGHNATQGAVNAVTDPDSKKKLASLLTDATKAARDEALGTTTDADLQKLLKSAGVTTRAEVQQLLKDAGVTTRAELEALITTALQEKLRQTARVTVDEVFGPPTLREVDALREHLVGQPFKDDLNGALDAAGPHLAQVVKQAVEAGLVPITTEVNTLKVQADAEATRWKPIAIGFGVGSGCLVVCIVVLGLALRSHRKVIESLATRLPSH